MKVDLPLLKPGPQWPSEMLPEFRESDPDRLLPHKDLKQALDLAVRFADDESPRKGEYFANQFDGFASAVEDHPDVIGVFGTGYPFYALKDDGGIHAIPEITRYVRSFAGNLDLDRRRGYGAWLCGACDVANNLPDLKLFCRPCDSVDFKPRDIFRALPDLDYWVVVKDSNTPTEAMQLEKEIYERTAFAGFYSSDADVVQAVENTKYAMATVLRGGNSPVSLPVDMHIVTKSKLMECMAAVPDAVRTDSVVPISPRSYHKVWENTDVPYDFVKDFLFSFTPHHWKDPELTETLQVVRQEVAGLVAEDPLGAVAKRAEKEARQLQAPGVQQCLRDRVASWQ